MTPHANHRVPLTIPLEDGDLLVQRAWPASNGALVIEGADARGRCRAARIDADGVATVSEYRHDSRLPGLASAPGAVIVHRLGKRAVLRDEAGGRYVKVMRPGRAAALHRATAPLAGALSSAGFALAEDSLGPDGDRILARVVPGTPMALLGADTWRLALEEFARSWTAFATALDAHAAPHRSHTGEDEASILSGWLENVEAFDPLMLSPAIARRFAEQVARSCHELSRRQMTRASLAHRDLHEGQLLFDERGGDLALLDLDTAAIAERELDLANLRAHVDFAAFRGGITQSMRDVARTMLERVLSDIGGDPARFDCYRVAAELRIACVWAFRPHAREHAAAWLSGER